MLQAYAIYRLFIYTFSRIIRLHHVTQAVQFCYRDIVNSIA
jgi:hypothetical protein